MLPNILGKKIRVLVVDDSLLMRNVISDIVSGDQGFEVVGIATDGKMAIDKIAALKPDVITLDVEMPVMDGIECLRHIMRDHPTPVVMVSSITYEGSFKTMQALSLGAFDFVQKPKAQASSAMHDVALDIRTKLREAVASGYIEKYTSQVKKPTFSVISGGAGGVSKEPMPEKLRHVKSFNDYVIAIGISTGGPPCISQIKWL